MSKKNIPLNQLPKIRRITAELASIIIWGVYDKFYLRNPRFKKNQENQINADVNKTILGSEIAKDIFNYCNLKYSSRNSNNTNVNEVVILMIKYVIYGDKDITDGSNENVASINYSNQFLNKRTYDGFMNLFPFLFRNMDTNIEIELARWQLEAFCLYAYDVTFDELSKGKNKFYISNKRIQFISSKLRSVFMPTLQSLFDSLEAVDSNCRSEKLMERACRMFKNETENLCKAFSNGHYSVPTEDFLPELMSLMEDCDEGFGISIPEFNSNWKNNKDGDNILLMNKKQSEGFLDHNMVKTKKPSPWIRIFLMNGVKKANQPYKLTKEEYSIIKKQLDYEVQVYIVFDAAWGHKKGKELQSLDFAILRIDGCPTLMGTQFEHSKTKGVFYTDESMPEKHFNVDLEKILSQENCEYIFEPKIINDSLDMGVHLNTFQVQNLRLRLKSIYEVSKQKE